MKLATVVIRLKIVVRYAFGLNRKGNSKMKIENDHKRH